MNRVIKYKKLHPEAIIPSYAHSYGDAGMDLFSIEDTVIKPGERKVVRTGIAGAPPKNTVALLLSKSGLAAKHGITHLGGVYDETYTGEITATLQNTGKEPFEIKKGNKIAQYVIVPVIYCKIKEVTELSDTVRGTGRMGSTGN